MPTLSPDKERFIAVYRELRNASEAFRVARPHSRAWKANTVHSRASELLLSSEIQDRLAELAAEDRERNAVTVEDLTEKLRETYDLARAEKQTGSMVAAVKSLAELHQLIIKKSETKLNGTVDHRHTHASEPVSETAEFVNAIAGRKENREGEEPLH